MVAETLAETAFETLTPDKEQAADFGRLGGATAALLLNQNPAIATPDSSVKNNFLHHVPKPLWHFWKVMVRVMIKPVFLPENLDKNNAHLCLFSRGLFFCATGVAFFGTKWHKNVLRQAASSFLVEPHLRAKILRFNLIDAFLRRSNGDLFAEPGIHIAQRGTLVRWL